MQFVYILQVDINGLYLQDDFTRVARFPNSLRNFETTMWRERTSLEVKGATVHAAVGDNFQIPTPQEFGILNAAGTSGTTSTQDSASGRSPSLRNALSHQKPKSPGEIRRKVFLAEFQAETFTPVPTATAYLKLKQDECTVTNVARLSKEYLNLEEDLVIIDNNGFEILDNANTCGKN